MSSAHGGQVVCSQATAELVEARAHGSRRAPAQGHRAGGPPLPARRGLVPSAQDDLEHESAASGELVRGQRGRARRSHLTHRGRGEARHPYRPRRLGEDAPRHRSRLHPRPRVQGRGLLGRPRLAARLGARSRDHLADPRRQGRARRARRRSRAPAPARQPRAGDRSSTRALDPPQACPNLTLLVTSRELLRISGEVEYAGASARGARGRLPLLRARTTRTLARRSPSSARASTRSRSPSSSPPRARRRSLPRRSSSASRLASTCSREAVTPIRASRRCEPRSSGRTSCSPPKNSSSSPASPSSPAAARSKPPRR